MMNDPGSWLGIVWPAFAAGVLVTLTHVPLGMQVLARGIVFIDLAIAQIAGLGIVAADWAGLPLSGWPAQACALSAALAGALALTWTDRRWPHLQEAVIGVAFALAASSALLLLAANPHGGEHLKTLLEGQVLWVSSPQLVALAAAYAVLGLIWFSLGRSVGRVGFYLLFACAVTASVQLVGLYLVFTTLIVPALATRAAAPQAGCRLHAEHSRLCARTRAFDPDRSACGTSHRLGDVRKRTGVPVLHRRAASCEPVHLKCRGAVALRPWEQSSSAGAGRRCVMTAG